MNTYENEGASAEVVIPQGFPPEVQAVTREVFNLWADPGVRGRGFARKLMQRIIKEADEAGFALILHCQAGDGQTDSERLQSFYESLGFRVFQTDPLLMCRPLNGGSSH